MKQKLKSCRIVKIKYLLVAQLILFLFVTQIPLRNGHANLERVLSQISDDHFFPPKLLRQYLENYSAEELERIYEDFTAIRDKTFSNAEKRPIYLATAGGPASGKTTLLENFLDTTPDHFAYIDPDRTCLPQMQLTYRKDLDRGTRDLYGAYVYWRAASNFMANTLLALALKEGYAIAHGTTMTASQTRTVLTSLRERYGYEVTLWHLTCEESVRAKSLQKRISCGNLQCTPEDFRDKGRFFFQRLPDYLYGANQIVFFYRSKMDSVTVAGKRVGGNLIVRDAGAFQKIQQAHDSQCGNGYWESKISHREGL